MYREYIGFDKKKERNCCFVGKLTQQKKVFLICLTQLKEWKIGGIDKLLDITTNNVLNVELVKIIIFHHFSRWNIKTYES
jgi:hypothetical protein